MALENKDNILQVFQTRARQLMYEYESVRKQRNELVKTVEQKELEIKKLHEKLENLEQSYQNLKTAKMIEINNGDVVKSKQRFEALVRQVDKCIALLNV
jgi:predicted nuclease with TOPRIM domain